MLWMNFAFLFAFVQNDASLEWNPEVFPVELLQQTLLISCSTFAFSRPGLGISALGKEGGSSAGICSFCCLLVTSPAIVTC